MKISVIGTGYVGLVSGTCLAEVGHDVICVDIDKDKVDQLKNGKIPIYEPGLEELVLKNVKANKLHFTTNLEDIGDPEVIFFALPTPPDGDGQADLKYVLSAAKDVAKILKSYTVLVNKSTVPVGTSKKVKDVVANETDIEFDVVSNPEFLREGFAVDDFLRADRIVVGTSSTKAREVMKRLYLPFTSEDIPLLLMDEASSEMTKYAANSFLAAKISFMNEIANLCEIVGADVDEVRSGIGADERIGHRFLFPGIGYGGSCFPKDVLALNRIAELNDYDFKILNAVMGVNDRQKHTLINKLKNYYDNELDGKVFALWGLAFKPDTDDIREAPSLIIIEELIKLGAKIKAYDPEAAENVKKIFGDHSLIEFVDNMYDVVKDVDAILIATEWAEFRAPDFARVKNLIKYPIIFDGRNLYDLELMKNEEFHYESIGRKTIVLEKQQV